MSSAADLADRERAAHSIARAAIGVSAHLERCAAAGQPLRRGGSTVVAVGGSDFSESDAFAVLRRAFIVREGSEAAALRSAIIDTCPGELLAPALEALAAGEVAMESLAEEGEEGGGEVEEERGEGGKESSS
jgi:hypothetical protein